jgi:uncharacterized iron-regulated membrane protein
MLEIRAPVSPAHAMLMRTEERYPMREQLELHLDPYTGEVVNRAEIETEPPLALFRAGAARFHLGLLYGWLNVAQNLIAAGLLLLLSVSGFVSWWKRRPRGKLGVPNGPDRVRMGVGLIVLTVFLGLAFPLMGLTLIAALILDWVFLRRLGWLRPGS